MVRLKVNYENHDFFLEIMGVRAYDLKYSTTIVRWKRPERPGCSVGMRERERAIKRASYKTTSVGDRESERDENMRLISTISTLPLYRCTISRQKSVLMSLRG